MLDPETPSDAIVESTSLVAVLLEPGSPKPVEEIVRALVDVVGEPAADAVRRLRFGAGLVAHSLEREPAKQLAEALQPIGVRTFSIPAHTWSEVPRGYKIRRLQFESDALRAHLVTGRELVLDRSQAGAFHLFGLVTEPEEGAEAERKDSAPPLAELAAAAGGSLTERGQRLLERLRSAGWAEIDLRLTIHTGEPIGCLRIHRDDFDYSSLQERKRTHSLDNYLALVDRLQEWAPGLWCPEETVAFLESLEPRKIVSSRREVADNTDRWLWHCLSREMANIDPHEDPTGDAPEEEPAA